MGFIAFDDKDDDLYVYRLTIDQLKSIGIDDLDDEVTIWEWISESAWNGMKGHQPYDPPGHISHASIHDAIPAGANNFESWDMLRQKLVDGELDTYLVEKDMSLKPQHWYCESPRCRHRENDTGHCCWWCGCKEGKTF